MEAVGGGVWFGLPGGVVDLWRGRDARPAATPADTVVCLMDSPDSQIRYSRIGISQGRCDRLTWGVWTGPWIASHRRATGQLIGCLCAGGHVLTSLAPMGHPSGAD